MTKTAELKLFHSPPEGGFPRNVHEAIERSFQKADILSARHIDGSRHIAEA